MADGSPSTNRGVQYYKTAVREKTHRNRSEIASKRTHKSRKNGAQQTSAVLRVHALRVAAIEVVTVETTAVRRQMRVVGRRRDRYRADAQ